MLFESDPADRQTMPLEVIEIVTVWGVYERPCGTAVCEEPTVALSFLYGVTFTLVADESTNRPAVALPSTTLPSIRTSLLALSSTAIPYFCVFEDCESKQRLPWITTPLCGPRREI